MRREAALTLLRAHEAELRAAGVEALYLFGSVARDEAGEGSDVDLFFDRDRTRRMTLLDLIGLQEQISDWLGRRVDLGDRAGIRPWARAAIEFSAEQVF